MKYLYLPYNKKLTERARSLRKNQTVAEKKIWYDYLRNHNYKFTRQKPIGNYIVDFYCSELGLVIEIDGVSHLSEDEIIYDKNRTEDLNMYGLKVLRFWNDDVLSGVEIVGEIINEEIKKIIPFNHKIPPTPACAGRPFVKGE